MSSRPGFEILPFDAVPAGDWVVAGVIDMTWQRFAEVFGVEFVENDGRWEAPGPVAYATLMLSDGSICPLEHHFDYYEGKVLVKAIRGTDTEALRARLASDLGLEPVAIASEYRSPAERRPTRVVTDRLVASNRKLPPESPTAFN